MRDGPSDDDNDGDGNRGCVHKSDGLFGTVSVKRKACDDIISLERAKKLREDEDASDEGGE